MLLIPDPSLPKEPAWAQLQLRFGWRKLGPSFGLYDNTEHDRIRRQAFKDEPISNKAKWFSQGCQNHAGGDIANCILCELRSVASGLSGIDVPTGVLRRKGAARQRVVHARIVSGKFVRAARSSRQAGSG